MTIEEILILPIKIAALALGASIFDLTFLDGTMMQKLLNYIEKRRKQ